MEMMPKIKGVKTIKEKKLLVTFSNGIEKIYDCELLFAKPQFQLLANPVFFKAVRLDPGGYGISWNDNIDLSEYELWTNGRTIPENSLRQEEGISGPGRQKGPNSRI
ncbi:MAG: DUF2442 domain-containing protein [Thermodesulfobacteriota bacterium]